MRAIRSIQNAILKSCRRRAASYLLFLLLPLSHSLSAAESAQELADAESSFHFIVTALQVRDEDSLPSGLDIDAADRARFVALLEAAYQDFSRDFNSESAMCRFYRDPENARMTIEERADLSRLYLRELDARLERIVAANVAFREALMQQFGGDVLVNIDAAKQGAVSNQRLPTSRFDEAALISFLDAMCT